MECFAKRMAGKVGKSTYSSRKFSEAMKSGEGNEAVVPRTTIRQVDLGVHAASLAEVPSGEYTYQIDVLLSNR